MTHSTVGGFPPPYLVGPCPICYLPMDASASADHLRFHKRHGHHAAWCSSWLPLSPVDSGIGTEQNPEQAPCTCLMLGVYV